MKARIALPSISLLLLSCPLAYGNVHDTFGVGAAAIGQGNAVTASVRGGAAAYYNPAALARTPGIRLDAGFQAFIPMFPDFENIVYDANQNGVIDEKADGSPETTSVANRYAPTLGLGLNAAIPITKWAAFGLSMYMPSSYLMRLEFTDPYVPYYPLYKNRTQRFSAYAGLGIRVFDGLFLGLGGSVATRIEAKGRISALMQIEAAQTDENGEAEVTRVISTIGIDNMTAAIKSAVSPNFSVLLNFGWVAEPLKTLNLAATYRGQSSVRTSLEVAANVLGDVTLADDKVFSGPLTDGPVLVSIQDLSSAINPMQLAAGLSYTLRDQLTISLDATYAQWSAFQEDFIAIPTTDVALEGVALITVRGSREIEGDPGTIWRDTVTPRLGLEFTNGLPRVKEGFKYSVRLGYGYHPSPIPEQTARVNMMDSDKHMISGGLGFDLPVGILKNPLRVDLFGSFHRLTARTHVKSEGIGPDENGDYPAGYPVAGSITSGGSVIGFGGSAGLTF